MRLIVIVLALVSSACTTEYGKSVAIGQGADIATTAIGLSQSLAEANPLGVALLPIKYGVTKYADTLPCVQGVKIEKVVNSVTYGASGLNIAVIAGLNPVVGLVIGAGTFIAYRLNKPIKCPTMRERVADNMAIYYGIFDETY